MAGRPPLPESERRKNKLQVRLSDDEMRLLHEVSGDASASTWAREVLLRAAKRKKKK